MKKSILKILAIAVPLLVIAFLIISKCTDLFSGSNPLKIDKTLTAYVTLEVEITQFIKESAVADAIDDTFNEIIEKTRADASLSNQPVLDIFMHNFNIIARPKGKSLISYFDMGDMLEFKEEKFIEKLNNRINDAVYQVKEVISTRLNISGFADAVIQKIGNRKLHIVIKGSCDEETMRKLILTRGFLGFHLVKNNSMATELFYKIDRIVSGKVIGNTSQTDKKSANTEDPYAGLSQEEVSKRYKADHPFTILFQTLYQYPDNDRRTIAVNYVSNKFIEGDYSFIIEEKNLIKFDSILNIPEIKALYQYDFRILREANPSQVFSKQTKNKFYNFHVIKLLPELTGEVIADASSGSEGKTNQSTVKLEMNVDGAERFARITGENIKKRIAIVLDDFVYSVPRIQSKITGGNVQVSGMATAEEAKLMEIVLKAGALKAPLKLIGLKIEKQKN
ncbi:MAG: hypothetical protein WCT77_03180 [Bacteroidota bacterium]